MAKLIDATDFAAYYRDSDLKAKVRAASDFAEDVSALSETRNQAPKDPEMFSTKLRGLLRFREGEVTAWAGYNGHKKSMFTTQVALDLCVQRKPVLVVSLEMLPERTLHRMARQAWGASEIPAWWLQQFMAWTDGRLWLFDHLGRITPETCIAACRYFAEEYSGQHVLIDSLMMVCGSEEHLDEQKQLVTDLVRVAQESSLHIHLVAHCRKPASGEERPPSKYDLRGSAAITDQCANVVTVWSDKAKKPEEFDKPDVLVTVEKQRNAEFEGRVKLWWHPTSMRFVDSTSEPVEAYRIALPEAA